MAKFLFTMLPANDLGLPTRTGSHKKLLVLHLGRNLRDSPGAQTRPAHTA